MIITRYLKSKIWRILFDAFCVFFFALVFKLSGLSLSIIFYPTLVCFFVWSIYIVYDFFKFKKNHEVLQGYKNNIDIYIDKIGNTNTVLESDYQELLQSLNSILCKRITEIESSKRETMDFVTLWSHEIKTPMTAINLLVQQIEQDKSVRGVREIKEKLFEIEQYVDMILQYVKLENINSDLVLKNYKIYDIVKEAVKYFSKTFISKNISLKLDEFQDTIVTDDKWVLFAIKQVLSNAVKYTDKGTISIYMKKHSSNVLIIEDTGIGIGNEDLPRIFERGFTGYNGHFYKKSTGIGLYITREILNRLNHSISIFSTVGIGTRVEISFNNLSTQ